MTDRQLGPATKKLIFTIFAKNAIPKGGGLADGIHSLCGNVSLQMKEAQKEAFAYIDAVKSAPDCHFKSDDEIAQEIINRIDQLKPKWND